MSKFPFSLASFGPAKVLAARRSWPHEVLGPTKYEPWNSVSVPFSHQRGQAPLKSADVRPARLLHSLVLK